MIPLGHDKQRPPRNEKISRQEISRISGLVITRKPKNRSASGMRIASFKKLNSAACQIQIYEFSPRFLPVKAGNKSVRQVA